MNSSVVSLDTEGGARKRARLRCRMGMDEAARRAVELFRSNAEYNTTIRSVASQRALDPTERGREAVKAVLKPWGIELSHHDLDRLETEVDWRQSDEELLRRVSKAMDY